MAKSTHEEVFRRIRTAGPIPVPEIPRNYRTRGSRLDIVVEMEEKLTDYMTKVTHAVVTADVPAAIAEALLDTVSVVVPPGPDPAWTETARKGREIHVDEPSLANAELDRIDAVVTVSRVTVVLLGTIVLDGAPDMGRRVISLAPDTHVVVLKASDIKAAVPETVIVLDENSTRPTTWIAGPSATLDIELVYVSDIHGPRNLRAIVVDGGGDNSNS